MLVLCRPVLFVLPMNLSELVPFVCAACLAQPILMGIAPVCALCTVHKSFQEPSTCLQTSVLFVLLVLAKNLDEIIPLVCLIKEFLMGTAPVLSRKG